MTSEKAKYNGRSYSLAWYLGALTRGKLTVTELCKRLEISTNSVGRSGTGKKTRRYVIFRNIAQILYRVKYLSAHQLTRISLLKHWAEDSEELGAISGDEHKVLRKYLSVLEYEIKKLS